MAFPLVALGVRNFLPAWGFMWVLAFSIYAGLKWLTWWQARSRISHPTWYSVAYLFAWPGMDAELFLDSSQRVPPPPLQDWFWSLFEAALGATCVWGVARVVPAACPLLRGWLGMLGIVLVLHFGTFRFLAVVWQACGIRAIPIMLNPLHSRSLSEFWGKRWNLGFRQLAHDLVFRPLHRKLGAGGAGFLVFILSGLIHDFVISVPARAGYGLPTLYFALQGIGVAIERSSLGKRLALRQGMRGWIFMAIFTAGPAYWLFHPPFVQRVILPFMQVIHAL